MAAAGGSTRSAAVSPPLAVYNGLMEWTTRQNMVLEEHAREGARSCTLALVEELGVERSVGSVKMHASRMGLSLAERHTCPECGHEGGPHDFRFNDGLCEACHVMRKARELDSRNSVLEREYRRRVGEAYRDHAKMRQRNKRLKDRLK